MSKESKKNQKLACEPLKDKKLVDLGGIGKMHAMDLKKRGFNDAAAVVGQFMAYNRNDDKFKEFIKRKGNANNGEAANCLQGVKGWCKNNL